MNKKIKVALVVGHSEKRKGAYNKNYEVYEYDYNLKLVNAIMDRLIDNYKNIDPIVILRDNKYIDLPDLINEEKPKFIISFHCNAFNKNVGGSEFLCWIDSIKSQEIAFKLNDNLINHNIFSSRSIKYIKSQEDRGGYLLKNTKAPCVIAETFFIDNDSDYEKAIKCNNQIISFYEESIIEICKDIFNFDIQEKKENIYLKNELDHLKNQFDFIHKRLNIIETSLEEIRKIK